MTFAHCIISPGERDVIEERAFLAGVLGSVWDPRFVPELEDVPNSNLDSDSPLDSLDADSEQD
jgi:hypothetical protein